MAETPLHFNPNAGQTTGRTGRRYWGKVSERLCPKCRVWFRPEDGCSNCVPQAPKDHVHINTGGCYKGWYEHLGPQPVWIESKAHLYKECKKRGLQARALMSGGEMKKPRGA